MHLKSHRLATGRFVYLERYAICRAGLGILEGSPEYVRRTILEDLPKTTEWMLPPAKPLLVISTSKEPLPAWICVAELDSCGAVCQREPFTHSMLYVAWFVEDTSHSIDSMLESILPLVDWDRHAQDYDIGDF